MRVVQRLKVCERDGHFRAQRLRLVQKLGAVGDRCIWAQVKHGKARAWTHAEVSGTMYGGASQIHHVIVAVSFTSRRHCPLSWSIIHSMLGRGDSQRRKIVTTVQVSSVVRWATIALPQPCFLHFQCFLHSGGTFIHVGGGVGRASGGASGGASAGALDGASAGELGWTSGWASAASALETHRGRGQQERRNQRQ